MKKILITGVGGFIGSNLAERLVREGYSVRGLDDFSAGVPEQVPKEVELHNIDIRSKEIHSFFKGVDVVFHLAARNSIEDCQRHPLETVDVNIMGAVNVFEACRLAHVERVIYAESSAIYEATKTLPTPETDFTPRTLYAITKAADHLIAKMYQEFYGLKMVGLRYFNVYGPRQDYRRPVPPVMSQFIIQLFKGKGPTIYGDGSMRHDFIHIDDVNDFNILCITDDRALNRVFNLASGENISVLELSRMIQKLMGTDIKPVFVPGVPGLTAANLGDIRQAESLGWAPKIGLEEGLKTMIAYIKQEMPKIK